MNPILVFENLRKSYGSLEAVRDVAYEVAREEIFGILGPNGAGETTTVECIQGLRSHDAGRILVLGRDPRTQAAEIQAEPRCRSIVAGIAAVTGLPATRLLRWE